MIDHHATQVSNTVRLIITQHFYIYVSFCGIVKQERMKEMVF